VLAALYHGTLEKELAKQDEVTAIVREREESLLCAQTGGEELDGDGITHAACLGLLEAADVDPTTIFPAPTWSSDVFTVTAEARVGEIVRRLEVVLDRSEPSDVRRLAWRMR